MAYLAGWYLIGTLLYEYSKTPANPPGDVLALSYPIAIAAVCFIIGALYLSNKQQKQAITD